MKYKVGVTFHSSQVVEVEASTPEAARMLVVNMVHDRDLLAEDLDESEWIVGDAKPGNPAIEIKTFDRVLPKKGDS